MRETTALKKWPFDDLRSQVETACSFFGISKGRLLENISLLREFIEEQKKSDRHILAFSELFDLIEIHRCWHPFIDEFSGLRERIQRVFTDGPLLAEYENSRNSGNRPRNDGFVFLLAGKLLHAGVEILGVDNIGKPGADIWIHSSGLDMPIECKRPQSKNTIKQRAREAVEQLGSRKGAVAIDCSKCVRPLEPLGYVLHAPDSSLPSIEICRFLNEQLSDGTPSIADLVMEAFRPFALGAILCLRAPVVFEGESRILDLKGNPYPFYTVGTVSHLEFLPNEKLSNNAHFQNMSALYHEGIARERH